MRFFTFLLIGMLSACAAVEERVDNSIRDRAGTVINTVVTDRFPNANPAPVTKCALDNASRGEILTLARAGVTGFDSGTVQTVLDIVTRAETIKCLLRSQIILS